MTITQILRTALEALEYYRNDEDWDWIRIGEEFHPTPAKASIAAIRAALEQQDNTRLIAAAPDLFYALVDLLGWQTLAPDEVVAKACAAIAKAEGKE